MNDSGRRYKRRNDVIFCLVGASGSGKSNISESMEKQGWIPLDSYTTRAKRTPDEKNHTFVDQLGFDNIRHDLVAHTIFDGNEYGATMTQVHNSHIYVVDPYGVQVLSEHLGRINIFVVYLDVTSENRFNRMLHTRGEQAAFERVKHDAHKYGSYSDYDILLPNNDPTQLLKNEVIISTLLESWYK